MANRVAQEVYAEFDVSTELIEGEIGSFDVYVNDEVIFSKAEIGRLPNLGEIIQEINKYLKK